MDVLAAPALVFANAHGLRTESSCQGDAQTSGSLTFIDPAVAVALTSELASLQPEKWCRAQIRALLLSDGELHLFADVHVSWDNWPTVHAALRNVVRRRGSR